MECGAYKVKGEEGGGQGATETTAAPPAEKSRIQLEHLTMGKLGGQLGSSLPRLLLRSRQPTGQIRCEIVWGH